MRRTAVAAMGLVGLVWTTDSTPPPVPDDEALAIAEAAFVASVSSDVGEPELVACAIDTFGQIQCYGIVYGETVDDPATLVIQTGWIDDDGEFSSLSEPRPISLADDDEDQADSPDDLRQRAEDYLTTYEFEVEANLYGRVENPRCETPETADEGETFGCRFDMVMTSGTVLLAEVRVRVEEGGGIFVYNLELVS